MSEMSFWWCYGTMYNTCVSTALYDKADWNACLYYRCKHFRIAQRTPRSFEVSENHAGGSIYNENDKFSPNNDLGSMIITETNHNPLYTLTEHT